ncbi:MAG: hypothetical protein B6245_14460 [Desulfobacteraceae bacterium 4572_88]|nr:MAG: hypothetical protein B6245_14460 [Desulfobacteraceae bacterium 4572_88]
MRESGFVFQPKPRIHLNVTFFSFFNSGGREEGTENTETCQDILCDPCALSAISAVRNIPGFPVLKLRKLTLNSFASRFQFIKE